MSRDREAEMPGGSSRMCRLAIVLQKHGKSFCRLFGFLQWCRRDDFNRKSNFILVVGRLRLPTIYLSVLHFLKMRAKVFVVLLSRVVALVLVTLPRSCCCGEAVCEPDRAAYGMCVVDWENNVVCTEGQ
jgi:hypothetical protein